MVKEKGWNDGPNKLSNIEINNVGEVWSYTTKTHWHMIENHWRSQLNVKILKCDDSKRYRLVKEKGWMVYRDTIRNVGEVWSYTTGNK